jgi:HEAT repeat protein
MTNERTQGTGPDHLDGSPSPFLSDPCWNKEAGVQPRNLWPCPIGSFRKSFPMQPLSQPTWDLIRQLYAPPTVVSWPRRLAEKRIELITRVVEIGEPAAIPELLSLTLAQGDVPEAAAMAVRQLLETVGPLELVNLDLLSRSFMAPWDSAIQAWRRLSPDHLMRLARLRDGWAVLAMATSHPSGRIREAAVRLLPPVAGRRGFPFLLLRLNDWVDPVRRAAAAEVETFMEAPDPEVVVDALPLILRMQSWGRRDHGRMVVRIFQLLSLPSARDALVRGLNSPDRTVRRECFRLAVEQSALDSVTLIERALADPDLWVRHQGALWLKTLDDEQLRKCLPGALADSSAVVRCEALRSFAARFPSEAVPRLQDSLLDPHPAVRELARTCLHQSAGGMDVAAYYREAIHYQSGRRLRAAILGLSESGLPSDDREILRYSAHAQAKVREAAVRALGRLKALRYRATILAAVADTSRRVSNEATRVIVRNRALLGVDTLGGYARSAEQPRHVRLNALRLLACLGKWDSLPFFLRDSCAPDAEVASAARAHVEGWIATYNQSFLQPSAAQLLAIDEALEPAAGHIKPTVRASIRAAVDYWRSSNR